MSGPVSSGANAPRPVDTIAATLFLGRRTVEWHLRHVFAQLGIHSRSQLITALVQG